MKLLSLARDLQRRKARDRQNLFVTEGVRAVEELLASPVRIVGALLSAGAADNARIAAVREAVMSRSIEHAIVTEAEFATASDTETPQGVLAVAEIPDRSLAEVTVAKHARILMLDALQDPGNVGTILRTAAAFDVTATIALPGTVDLWNAKVVRAAMGALFRHHALTATWADVDAFVNEQDITVWGADAAGARLGDRGAPQKLGIVVGNEGSGLTEDARTRATHLVSINTTSTVESLNVAVATGILLHHFRL
jgi:RNA methyltransferase, TrmH family